MLHRLSLRVLPQLSLAVTEPEIRTRKRIVMFVVGLIAFAAYRLGKLVIPLSDPLALLAYTAALSAVIAGASFAAARRLPLTQLPMAETPRRWAWLLGWTGAVYGVQLALLVLALLQICVNYDFLQHPDGPAMMAVIISCSAVSRDAVEIGHLRWMETQGRSFLTFPDGGSLRGLLVGYPADMLRSASIGLLVCATGSWIIGAFSTRSMAPLAQLLMVTVLGGSAALYAYLAGLSAPGAWNERWRQAHWMELAKFLWWPGFAFAATYFLVLYGIAEFVLRAASRSRMQFGFLAAGTGFLMGLYCYYLGARRAFEDRIHATVPSSMLRCPFITGILGKHKSISAPEAAAFSKAAHPVAME